MPSRKASIVIGLALYQPDIPQNAGTLMRLASCLGFPLHIIHPTGFGISDKNLRRSVMDYAEAAEIVHHDSFERFQSWCARNRRRQVLLTTKAARSGYEFGFEPADILMVGRETSGVPESVSASADAKVRIPMRPRMRSINVAAAAAMMMGEAMRQTGAFGELA